MKPLSLGSCPSSELLGDFAAGRLDDAAVENLATHLEACPACVGKVEAESASADPFLDQVRRVHQTVAPGQSTGCIAPMPETGRESKYFHARGEGRLVRDAQAFFTALRRSGLFRESELAALHGEWVAFRSTDAATFAQALIVQGKLTRFQARQLLRGRSEGWVLGNHVILHPVDSSAGTFLAFDRMARRTVVLEILPPIQPAAGPEITDSRQVESTLESCGIRYTIVTEPDNAVGDRPRSSVTRSAFAWMGALFAGVVIAIGIASLVSRERHRAANRPATSEDSRPPGLARGPLPTEQGGRLQQSWADHLGIPVEAVNSIGMRLRLIPPGTAMLGSSETEVARRLRALQPASAAWQWLKRSGPLELPAHRVEFTQPYYLGTTEVTVENFRAFVESTGHLTHAEKDRDGGVSYVQGQFRRQAPAFTWRTPGFATRGNTPVVQVSWDDAHAFCRWLSAREGKTYAIPTEAQWEYACRGGNASRWLWGDDPEGWKNHVAMPEGDGYGPRATASRMPNSFGLYDMAGNVAEWCEDRFDPEYRPTGSLRDPVGSDLGTLRVIRGGSFLSPLPDGVACATRQGPHADDPCCDHVGFRVAIVNLRGSARTSK